MGQDSYASSSWTIRIGIVMLFVVGFVLSFVSILSGRPHHGILKPSTQLRSVAQGLSVYAGNNAGQFPDPEHWKQVLVEEGICMDEFFSIYDEDKDGETYFLVTSQMSSDPTKIMVYEDLDHHKEGVLTAFSDLRVEFVGFEDFERMLADQLAPQDQDPTPETP